MYRIGSKFTAVVGAIVITAGSVWLASVTLGSPAWMFVAIMVLVGLGMGCATTPITVLIQSAVSWNLRGAATASSTFVRSLGQTVGIAILGTMFNQSLANYAKDHFQGKGEWQGRGDMSQMLQPDIMHHLPAQAVQMIHELLEHGLHTVFVAVLVGAILSVIAVLLYAIAQVNYGPAGAGVEAGPVDGFTEKGRFRYVRERPFLCLCALAKTGCKRGTSRVPSSVKYPRISTPRNPSPFLQRKPLFTDTLRQILTW